MNRRIFILSSLSAPFAARMAHAASPPVFATGGVAINGYDPVACFIESAPVAGSGAFTADWQGANWQFANAENRQMFLNDPDVYAPRYGGYCACAAAHGYIATTEPDAWTIHENRLYLNFNRRVRGLWRADIPGFVARADANWPAILNA